MMQTPVRSIAFALLFLTPAWVGVTPNLQAAEVEIENNPYFITLLQIGLQKEQVPRFKELLGDYANDRQMAIEVELRRREPNIEYRIRRAIAGITEDFLALMDALLDDDQFERYPPFQEELVKMLLGRESLAQDNDEEGIFPNQS